MKNGFTLVELSIVLVIIGLLIGGILVGQSLIDTAKTQRFISDLRQYDSMIAQFESRYRALPGDTDLFTVTARGVAVAGDGQIGDSGVGSGMFNSEVGHFWRHLGEAGMLDTVYSATVSPGVTAGVHTPTIWNDNVGLIVEYSVIIADSYNYYYVGDLSSSVSIYGAANMTEFLKATDALAIDTKIDDGLAIDVTQDTNMIAGTCTTGTSYNPASTALCDSVIIRVGASIE